MNQTTCKVFLFFLLAICSFCFVQAQGISFNPNTGEKGSTFGVTVTGTGTFFQQGTTTCIQIFANPSTISLTNVNVQNFESLTGTISIPANTVPGTYGGRVFWGPGCTDPLFNWSCNNCFTVTTCSTVVTTNAASGPGSLRDVVACAESGSTITFNSVSSVILDLPSIPVDKPLTLNASSQDITITNLNSANISPLLNVSKPLILTGLKLSGNTNESLIFLIEPNGSIDVNDGSIERTIINKQ